MKNRWITAPLAAAALALAGCAPDQGGGASTAPSIAPPSASSAAHGGESAEPMESEAAAPEETEAAEPTPEDYEY